MEGADELQRLGQVLIEEGVITHEEVQKVLEQAGALQSPLGELLLGAGFVRREDLAAFLAQKFTIPRLSLTQVAIHPDMIRLIPPDFARKHEVVPIAKLGDLICVAKANFFNRAALIELRRISGSKILVLQSSEAEVLDALRTYYPEGGAAAAPEPPPPASVRSPEPEPVAAPAPASAGGSRRMPAPAESTRPPTPAPAPVATEAPALLNAPKPIPKCPPPASIPSRAAGVLMAARLSEAEFRAAQQGLSEDPIAEFEEMFASDKPIPAIPMGQS